MPIGFSCGQCGKDYLVSDGLAGKRAVCKACGNRMIIPASEVEPEPRPSPVVIRSPTIKSRPTSSAPRPSSARSDSPPMRFAPEPGRSTRAAAPVPKVKSAPKFEPPVEDLYGLDEAPSALPPIMPRVGGGDESDALAGSPVKKKKKKGFFSSGGKKSSSGRSSFFDGLGASPLRLVIFAIFAVGGAVGAFSLSSRSEVEAFTQRQLDMTNEMTSILQTVNSVPTAQSASPRLNALLQRMIENLEGAKDKKASKTVLNAVIHKMRPLQEAAQASLMREVNRIATIPGAAQALQIEEQINRLAQLESEAKASAARDGLDTN